MRPVEYCNATRYNSIMIFVRRLIWDTWNVTHIARHNVTPDEVEQVCHGSPMAYEGYEGYEGRIMLIGPTATGRMLGVVLAPEAAGVYYSVTARPASRKECRKYQEDRGDERNDENYAGKEQHHT